MLRQNGCAEDHLQIPVQLTVSAFSVDFYFSLLSDDYNLTPREALWQLCVDHWSPKLLGMHFQPPQSAGGDTEQSKAANADKSSSLPFSNGVALSSVSGTTYSTALTLVQSVAYLLSDKVFTYSPDTFDLDVAVQQWKGEQHPNVFGFVPGVQSMETRAGAGSIALGYVFSSDFDVSKRHIPQSIIGSSGSLLSLRDSLEQLSLLHALTNPFVAHIAAVDYNPGTSSGLVPDYTTALSLADELGLGLVSSSSAYEAQHMALLATLLANVLPTMHAYDGIIAGRETTLVSDVLDQHKLKAAYDSLLKQLTGTKGKHSDNEGKALRLLKAFNKKLGTNYKPFEYSGHPDAEHVIVVFGTS